MFCFLYLCISAIFNSKNISTSQSKDIHVNNKKKPIIVLYLFQRQNFISVDSILIRRF